MDLRYFASPSIGGMMRVVLAHIVTVGMAFAVVFHHGDPHAPERGKPSPFRIMVPQATVTTSGHGYISGEYSPRTTQVFGVEFVVVSTPTDPRSGSVLSSAGVTAKSA